MDGATVAGKNAHRRFRKKSCSAKETKLLVCVATVKSKQPLRRRRRDLVLKAKRGLSFLTKLNDVVIYRMIKLRRLFPPNLRWAPCHPTVCATAAIAHTAVLVSQRYYCATVTLHLYQMCGALSSGPIPHHNLATGPRPNPPQLEHKTCGLYIFSPARPPYTTPYTPTVHASLPTKPPPGRLGSWWRRCRLQVFTGQCPIAPFESLQRRFSFKTSLRMQRCH